MLRAKATCAVITSFIQLRYNDGALHSTSNKPAVVFPHLKKVPCSDSMLYLIRWVEGGDIFYEKTAYRPGEAQWYYEGDIHRDYGPAVVGADYWYKYYRGKLAASDVNTYVGSRLFIARMNRLANDFIEWPLGWEMRTTMRINETVKMSLVKYVQQRSAELHAYCIAKCEGCAVLVACDSAWHQGTRFVYQTCGGLVHDFPGSSYACGFYRVASHVPLSSKRSVYTGEHLRSRSPGPEMYR
jgi:hypothetical protein